MPNPLLLVIGVVVGAALGALIAYVWLGSVRRQRDLVSRRWSSRPKRKPTASA